MDVSTGLTSSYKPGRHRHPRPVGDWSVQALSCTSGYNHLERWGIVQRWWGLRLQWSSRFKSPCVRKTSEPGPKIENACLHEKSSRSLGLQLLLPAADQTVQGQPPSKWLFW